MTDHLQNITAKLMTLDQLNAKLTAQNAPQNIVFTNGCFDVLHVGHVTYLAKAASMGDFFIIGLNTDQSVKRQGKGDDRPVNMERDRALILAALVFVDAVVLFDADTPLNLIQSIQPDILVKGGDYDPEETNPESKKFIVGSDVVRNKGGKVATVSLVEGYSTTSTLARIRKNTQ
jgi:D-glycero-beta-D-manno-heptose 1-phosphate adenylyltransferase